MLCTTFFDELSILFLELDAGFPLVGKIFKKSGIRFHFFKALKRRELADKVGKGW